MFLQLYQIILKFLYVCQSVIWLTSLMKLHKLRNLQLWMRYLSEISWRHSQDFDTLFPNNFEFSLCLSVCQLAYFLTEIRSIQGYLKLWMRFLSEIFWRFSQDISGLFPNYLNNFVSLSVCQLAYFLTEIRLIYGYLQFQMRCLSEIFIRHSKNISGLFPNYSEFFV